jgi:TonB family protein
MNSCPSFRQHLLIGPAALFLFVGWAAMAQQPGVDKPKEKIAMAGRDGVSVPKCEYCPNPEYSQEARKKKYEGVVVLVVAVTSEGKAANIQVIKSPGLGLDKEAVEAVRKWRFKPAMKDGMPVAAKVPIEVTFHVAS